MHPCRMEQIDSVKIDPSLVMMRECSVQYQPYLSPSQNLIVSSSLCPNVCVPKKLNASGQRWLMVENVCIQNGRKWIELDESGKDERK